MIEPPGHPVFPTPLDAYPVVDGGLLATLAARLHANPFNAVVTGIFALAILHTFMAARFTTIAHDVQHRHDEARRREGLGPQPSLPAELLHFVGEIEVIFGLWAIVLLVAMTAHLGWDTTQHFFNDTVNYTEPMFVVVIMALASTRPVVGFAEAALRRVASIGHGTPLAWWLSILTIGPVLGSFITEPAAMTICALLLARQFYDLQPVVTPQVRDARPAVCERVHRRNADPLCRAPHPDGRPHLGLGHHVCHEPLRLAIGAGDPGVERDLPPHVSARARRPGAPRPRARPRTAGRR